MGLWDAPSDRDYYDGRWVPRPNATCAQCHRAFTKGRDDTGALCNACLVGWELVKVCAWCGTRRIHTLTADGAVCQTCADNAVKTDA